MSTPDPPATLRIPNPSNAAANADKMDFGFPHHNDPNTPAKSNPRHTRPSKPPPPMPSPLYPKSAPAGKSRKTPPQIRPKTTSQHASPCCANNLYLDWSCPLATPILAPEPSKSTPPSDTPTSAVSHRPAPPISPAKRHRYSLDTNTQKNVPNYHLHDAPSPTVPSPFPASNDEKNHTSNPSPPSEPIPHFACDNPLHRPSLRCTQPPTPSLNQPQTARHPHSPFHEVQNSCGPSQTENPPKQTTEP